MHNPVQHHQHSGWRFGLETAVGRFDGALGVCPTPNFDRSHFRGVVLGRFEIPGSVDAVMGVTLCL
jgi:hypothetical protein